MKHAVACARLFHIATSVWWLACPSRCVELVCQDHFNRLWPSNCEADNFGQVKLGPCMRLTRMFLETGGICVGNESHIMILRNWVYRDDRNKPKKKIVPTPPMVRKPRNAHFARKMLGAECNQCSIVSRVMFRLTT